MQHTIGVLIAALFIMQAADAQTMFRCQDGDRTVYSDKPCWQGVEVKRMTSTGATTPDERAKAQMRARAQERVAVPPSAVAAMKQAPAKAAAAPNATAGAAGKEAAAPR